jgi:hypothetical protein
MAWWAFWQACYYFAQLKQVHERRSLCLNVAGHIFILSFIHGFSFVITWHTVHDIHSHTLHVDLNVTFDWKEKLYYNNTRTVKRYSGHLSMIAIFLLTTDRLDCYELQGGNVHVYYVVVDD